MHLMRRFGFGEKWRKWIWLCDSQFFFSFLFFINDRPYSLEVQRALRQGDILSSLLFILVMELFSIMLHKNVGVGYLTGFQVEGGEVMVIFHLEFTDDSIIAKSKWTWLCSRQYQVKGDAAMEDGFLIFWKFPYSRILFLIGK